MATAMLTGTQKAAMLLLQLGRERAARVMAQLDVAEIEELTAEIMRLTASTRPWPTRSWRSSTPPR